MPFRTDFNQKTKKFETYRISSSGTIFGQEGRIVQKHEAPLGVQQKAREVKQQGLRIGKKKP